MAKPTCAKSLNAQLDMTTSTTYKVKYIQMMSQNCANSVKKNQKHFTTYSMNAHAFNKHDSSYQPIINTNKWDSADIIVFSHIPVIDSALTFE